jgi:hypothetical protein
MNNPRADDQMSRALARQMADAIEARDWRRVEMWAGAAFARMEKLRVPDPGAES